MTTTITDEFLVRNVGYFVRIIDKGEFGDECPFVLLMDSYAESLNLPEGLIAFNVLRKTESSYILTNKIKETERDRFEGSLVSYKDSKLHEGYVFNDLMLEDEYIEKSIEEFANEKV